MGRKSPSPIAQGSVVAIGAALLFGITTPLVKHFGTGVGAFATASLLYMGAALGAGVPRSRPNEPMLGRTQMGRTVLVAVFGAARSPGGFSVRARWLARCC
jgi:hypothetical protein